MKDNEFTTLMRRKALLEIAFVEAEDKAHERMPDAGKSREDYESWRAWNLILMAVSRAIAEINDQLGLPFLSEGLYTSEIRRDDQQFLDAAEKAVQDFYMGRLTAQDILMASAFDLARQATKKMKSIVDVEQ
jgi:hypothetical protein